MDRIKGEHVSARLLNRHSFIADLIYMDGPLLTLMRDDRRNWIYYWCDTDGYKKERYIVQVVERSVLLSYLQKKTSLLSLIESNPAKFVLDVTTAGVAPEEDDAKIRGFHAHRNLKRVSDLASLSDYLPAADAYFDEDLSPDVTLTKELAPSLYGVDILGDWFVTDLAKFSAVYEQLYNFFYCTAPRFVTNIGERVRGCLHAPWVGGFSRVNLFFALKQFVPSLHDLRVKKISYASPGQIDLEALPSVGGAISGVVGRYLSKREEMRELERKLDNFLTQAKLKRQDLSRVGNDSLRLTSENISYLQAHLKEISETLQCSDEIARINEYSPNIVVSTKVTLAFLSRVRRLAEFQNVGLVHFVDVATHTQDELVEFDDI